MLRTIVNLQRLLQMQIDQLTFCQRHATCVLQRLNDDALDYFADDDGDDFHWEGGYPSLALH